MTTIKDRVNGHISIKYKSTDGKLHTIDKDITPEDMAKVRKWKRGKKLKISFTPIEANLQKKEITTIPSTAPQETKAKVSTHYLNSLFTTPDTLRKYAKQLNFNDFIDGEGKLEIQKNQINTYIGTKGFTGINLNYRERSVITGIYSLMQKQSANEKKPYIELNSRRQLYEEILEKKSHKTRKDGYAFKDFSGAEVKQIDEALDSLAKTQQQVIVKGISKYDPKTKKPLYFFYMRETSLISIEYLKENIPADKSETITQEELKETGRLKISFLPIFLKDYDNYFRLIPKHLDREIKTACPEVKRISEPIVNFIDFLHRQDDKVVRRTRQTLIKELKLEEALKKQGKKYINDIILKCYDIAKRTGYLDNYELDQEGKFDPVDILYLNPLKIEHLKPKKINGGQVEALPFSPKE